MKNLLFIFFICLTTSVFAQSKAISRFQEKHESGQSLFFYPSTLRMINVEKNPDYYQLVSHVDKLQFLTFDKTANVISLEAVKQLRQDIRKENYQEMLSMDDQTKSIRIYALGEGNQPQGIVGIIDNAQSLILLDMEGFINMASLLKLMQSDFNFGMITKLVNTTAKQENQSSENPENNH